MTESGNRLGAAEIKNHAFFRGIDWQNLKSLSPPFIPNLKSTIDTRYFDKFEEIEPWIVYAQ